MTIKNIVGRAVAVTTAACLIGALPAAATEATASPAPDQNASVSTERPDTALEAVENLSAPKQGQPTPLAGDDYEEVPIDGSGEPPTSDTPPDAGDGKIVARYDSLPASVQDQIGRPTASEVVVNNELRYRDYEHARFYWTPDYGVKIVFGAILDKFLALGAHETFGVPTTDELATEDGARYNEFVNLAFGHVNAIYWTPQTGAHEIGWQVLGHWRALGAGSNLGYPTTDTTLTPDGRGLYNHFETATGAPTSIYYTQPYGANAIRGAIRTKWAASGWEQGPMGYPISDELPTVDGVGRANIFSGQDAYPAAIVWSPTTGAHSVKGLIFMKYSSLNFAAGPLGYPTTDELPTPDRRGRFNHFTGSGGASIYWTASTGAHEVYGAIRDRWASLGWENSYLGYPTSGEYDVPWGRRTDFEGGFIDWHSATGKVYDGRW